MISTRRPTGLSVSKKLCRLSFRSLWDIFGEVTFVGQTDSATVATKRIVTRLVVLHVSPLDVGRLLRDRLCLLLGKGNRRTPRLFRALEFSMGKTFAFAFIECCRPETDEHFSQVSSANWR